MKSQKIIQWLPSFLILVGVSFWLKILCFSPITNQHEAKLASYFQDNFEYSSTLIDSINSNLLFDMKAAILNGAGDKSLFFTGNKMIEFQQIAADELNRKLAQSDTNTYQIISDFHTNTTELLWKISKENPIITNEDIEQLLKRTQFKHTARFNDINYKIAFQKNQIAQHVAYYLNYLAGRIGHAYCGIDVFRAIIIFNETLKTGNTSNGKIVLNSSRYDKMFSDAWRTNGRILPSRDGVARLTEQFTNNSPKVLNLECEYYKERFNQYEMLIDTFILKEQFIIHPIKKQQSYEVE